ncbi:MAG TPA: ABC transporter substrate-binding protein [Burkholderiales bacterium]|nr:ABC transporter substrate-binding protein [Burkholderiales bacterium]
MLIVATLLIAGYTWVTRTSPLQPPGPLEQVTIAVSNGYAGPCSIFAAQEKGYFVSEGVQVAIQPHVSGKAALDATLQGRAHLGTVADVPIMFAVMNNQPVSVIATIFTAEKNHGIVARKDKGVDTPANLRGKRIGVTLGTSGHFFLDVFLNRHNLSANEVKILAVEPGEMSTILMRGDIDAVATWEPFLSALLPSLGGNGTIFHGKDVYDSVFTIAGTQKYVVSHPETVKKVLRAVVRGGRFCKDTPDRAREIVAKAIKTDAVKLKALWPSYRFNVTLDQGLLLALEDETRWAVKNKLTGRIDMPNYLNHVFLDGLEVVAPTAVTVIH